MSNGDTTIQPRKPRLALAASLVMPGLGQVYNGEATKGLLLFLGIGALNPVGAWLGLHGPGQALWLVMLAAVVASIGLYGFAVVDAHRGARRAARDYRLQVFNRAYVYILLFILGYMFVYGDMIHATQRNLLQSYRIPSRSMEPTLLPGDFLFADKRVNCLGCKQQIHRGDVAIFISPNNRTILFAKRVIGLPGDRVDIDGTDVRVNGKSIRRGEVRDFDNKELNGLLTEHVAYRETGDRGSYVVIWKRHAQHAAYSVVVPNGQVFTLGDNRDASQDSRRVGTIPLADIVGKARQVWLSVAPGRGVRWHRFGQLLSPGRGH